MIYRPCNVYFNGIEYWGVLLAYIYITRGSAYEIVHLIKLINSVEK